jgi:pimeloyl-ACP methyl ester carboxylesterase
VTLVGHDVGAMVVYAYVKDHPTTLRRAGILDVVIPGVEPWSKVISNPHLWHFAFHAVPELPEILVRGHERRYVDFFFDALSANPARIGGAARAAYAGAYERPEALAAGFDWYRAFGRDAEDNASSAHRAVDLPVLYVRGSRETGDIEEYLQGLRAAGVSRLRGVRIEDSGHFTADEQPSALADALRRFVEEN